jgi:hypothetical protein
LFLPWKKCASLKKIAVDIGYSLFSNLYIIKGGLSKTGINWQTIANVDSIPNLNHGKKEAAHGDMSRQWGEALRYFKKHSYRGFLPYNATMWHVKLFFQILGQNLRHVHVFLFNSLKLF